MLHIQTILFPTDDSAVAQAARAVADRLAAHHHATLHVLRVEPVGTNGDLTRATTPDVTTGSVVEAWRRHPTAADAITDYADEVTATLIVMGTHGRTGWNRLSLGSTAERVLRQAPCPVLTVGPEARPETRGPVLAPLAFESSSDIALETAVALAEDLGTSVVALHVVEPVELPIPYALPVEPFDETAIDARVRQALTQWVADHDGAPVATEVRHGSPALHIVNLAGETGASLIVQSTHGRRGLSRWLLGSVAEEVARRAPCPVLTLRMDARHIVRPDGERLLAVPRDDWPALFDALSRRAKALEHHVSVDVVSPAASGTVFRDLSLIGLTYDAGTDELDVIAEGSEHHVLRPFAVRSEAGAWTLDGVLDPEAPGPWTLDVIGADGIRERIVIRALPQEVSA